MKEFLYKQRNFNEKLEIGKIGEVFVKKYFKYIFHKLMLNERYNLEFSKTIGTKGYNFDTSEFEQKVQKLDGCVKFIDRIPYNAKTRQHGVSFFGDILFQIGTRYWKNGNRYDKIDYSGEKRGWFFSDSIFTNMNIIYLFLGEDNKKVISGYDVILRNFKKHYPPEEYLKIKGNWLFTKPPIYEVCSSGKLSFSISIREALKLEDSVFDITDIIKKINEGKVPKGLL